MDIRSKAGHVLATSDDPDARSLAASVLGQDPEPSEHTGADLRRILGKIEGREGQSERAKMIRAQLGAMNGQGRTD